MVNNMAGEFKKLFLFPGLFYKNFVAPNKIGFKRRGSQQNGKAK